MTESERVPGYLKLFQEGVLLERMRRLQAILASCVLCPRRCRVNRLEGQLGACGVDARAKVAAMSIHPWEEPPISGTKGSGAIFFSGCALRCLFCQNYPISQMGVGRYLSSEQLAEAMLKLQRRGAHNINLVTSTHQMPAVVQALDLAVREGLRIPLVYNTGGYESVETLRLLEGIIDIYLPDIKYDEDAAAGFCSAAEDYVHHNRPALLEMWRQVGALQVDERGVAVRGMLVRHLVLPENLSGSRRCLGFLAKELGTEVWVSLMDQYFPAHHAHGTPPLDRKVSAREYEQAVAVLARLGLENGFLQSSSDICEGSAAR